jgi:spore coat protein U-like protein
MTPVNVRIELKRRACRPNVTAVALIAAFALLIMLPRPATANGSVNGSVTCSVVSTTLSFNAYEPISGAADTLPTGTISVQCTSTSNSAISVSYHLTLATSPARTMTSSANSLTYDLFIDSARTIQWNTTNQVSCTFSVSARAVNQQSSCSFYGKIPASQNVAAGSYSQTGLGVGGTWSCNPVPSSGCGGPPIKD